jgi:hypothetical protein
MKNSAGADLQICEFIENARLKSLPEIEFVQRRINELQTLDRP